MTKRSMLSPGQWAAYFILLCILVGAVLLSAYFVNH